MFSVNSKCGCVRPGLSIEENILWAKQKLELIFDFVTHHVLNFTGGAAHHRASSSSNTDVLAERMDRHVCSPGILLPCVAIAVCCHKSSISLFRH